MKKALLKDTLREIKKSFGRFISIFAIVGIGVAFFAGVKDSVPVMKNTADGYYDDYNFMDLKIMSTMGLTDEDIESLKKTSGVLGVYGSHSMDVLNTQDSQQRVFKLMSMPLQADAKDKDYINQVRIINGRLPQKEDEVVIEYNKIQGTNAKIGDTLSFTSGTDESIDVSLKHTTYKIVGEVTMPYYLSFEKGSSTIGSGQINNYALIPEGNFKQDVYSEAYVTIKNAAALNSYDDAYFDVIKPIKNNVTDIGKEQAKKRYLDIKDGAIQKIEDGRKEYTENKELYDTKIAEAKQTLRDSELQLQNAQATLDKEKATIAQTLQDKDNELQAAVNTKVELQQLYTQNQPAYEESKAQFEAQYPALQTQVATLQKSIEQLEYAIAGIDAQLQNPTLTEEQKTALLSQKEVFKGQRDAATSGVEEIHQQVTGAQQQLAQGKAQLDQLQQNITMIEEKVRDGQAQLAQGKETANKEFAAAQAKIEDGKKSLAEGKNTLASEEKDGADKLWKAKEELDRGEEDVLAIKEPSWYVLDRHSHYSYMDYGSAADRMGAIAKVFPLFFFLVAALVCLTTMTRMVDEQRQEIGTLKALGYTKASIAMKFVAYAAIASVFGGIFGAIIGMIIFPTVIFNAWGIMYTLPEVELYPDVGLALLAIGMASSITIIAAIVACYKDLMETPALLMRPKAPKNGKKILLERVPFVWKHFNFIQKVTARNIFRYKKRFLMTVIGISGCSALLIAGFGIRDSIGEIATKQYGDIYMFDVSMEYQEDTSLSQKDVLLEDLQKDKNVEAATTMGVFHGFYADAGEDKGIDIYVPENELDFSTFIDLRTRVGREPIKLSDDGAVITEKLAKVKNLSIGDHIAIDNGDGVKKKIKINAISENYVGHAIYMSPQYYKSIYHKTPGVTTMFADLKDPSTGQEARLGNAFMNNEKIDSITFYSGIASSFQDTISSLSIIVVVLIISAGLLAFVVLYNLSNVNISERLREIATIKVLGFYDKEVSAYVYRESIILSFIGACFGLLLGIALHRLIMSLAELDTVMFGRNINTISFIYSILITMGFSILVNLVMFHKLQKIPMVESLKSVE